MTQTTITLWGTRNSPYVRKILVALAEKDLSYHWEETLPVVLLKASNQPVPPTLERVSPLGRIPAIQDGDFHTADSAVIAGYLDRQYHGGNRLYPEDPKAYARALWFEQYSDRELTAVSFRKIFVEGFAKPKVLKRSVDTEKIEKAIAEDLPPLLSYLNQQLQESAWLAGDAFSMADVAVVTQLLAMEMAGYPLNADEWPALQRLLISALARPSFDGEILGLVN